MSAQGTLRIVVVGAGGHGKVIISMLQRGDAYSVCGYVDPTDSGPVLDVPHLGDDSMLAEIAQKCGNAVIGVGSLGDVRARVAAFERCRAAGFDMPAITAPTAVSGHHVAIGDGTVLMDGVVVQPGTQIGHCAILNTRSSIDHDCRIGDFAHIAPGATLSGEATIGDRAHVGTGATIIQGIRVGERCIIGAGAVVVEDCEAGQTYTGVPATRHEPSRNSK